MSVVYRLIVKEPTGYATGATYPGCSSTNTGPCSAKWYGLGFLAQAVDDAYVNGEVPYMLENDSQVWPTVQAVLGGTFTPDPTKVLAPGASDAGVSSGGFLGLSTTELVIGAAAIYFLFLRRRG